MLLDGFEADGKRLPRSGRQALKEVELEEGVVGAASGARASTRRGCDSGTEGAMLSLNNRCTKPVGLFGERANRTAPPPAGSR